MNQLITVPNYTPMTVNYIKEVIFCINGNYAEMQFHPIMPWYEGYRLRSPMRLKLIKFYSKFIFKNSFRGQYYTDKEIIRDDPLECFDYIKEKYKKLKLDKFIDEKVEYFLDTKVKEKNVNSFCIMVYYLRIREPIVSYIEQTIGGTKELKQLKQLKQLFAVDNNLTFEEFLDKKTKFLMDIDLSGYVDELNKITERKMKRVLE